MSQGKKFRELVKNNNPLQVFGAVNAYCATMAEKNGVKALYLSGAGVANASYGMPDLAVTNLNDVLIDVARITQASSLPLLVDIDTGWGGAFNIARCIKELTKNSAAAAHIEDQVSQKRCGHRPGKELVAAEEMVDRIKAAVDARTDHDFVIMARTDAYQLGGMPEVISRCDKYIAAGADMIFAEALPTAAAFKELTALCKVPVLANITEFGQTPLLTTTELAAAGVKLALYPLSAFRAMNKAAERVYQEMIKTGGQKHLTAEMQTREELYKYLDYYSFEEKLDQLFGKEHNK